MNGNKLRCAVAKVVKKQHLVWQNNSETWRSAIALRLKSPDALPSCWDRFSVNTVGNWLDTRNKELSYSLCTKTVEEYHLRSNWNDQLVLGSVVTNKQHNKAYVDVVCRLVVLHSVLIQDHEETDNSQHSVIYRPVGSTMQLVTKLSPPNFCRAPRDIGTWSPWSSTYRDVCAERVDIPTPRTLTSNSVQSCVPSPTTPKSQHITQVPTYNLYMSVGVMKD